MVLLRCHCVPAGNLADGGATAARRLLDGAPRRAAARLSGNARVTIRVLRPAPIPSVGFGLEDALRLASAAVVMSRQRRKDWHSVRKGACVWIFRRREGAARQTLSPGDRAIRGSRRWGARIGQAPIEDAKGASMSIKLTDTQLVLLGAAAQRKDLCLVALPTLKGATAQKVARKLISIGFVKEVKARASDPIWQRDEESGASYALKLTAAGAKAIAVDDAAEPEDAGEESAALANRDQAAIQAKLAANDVRPAEAMELGPARPSAPRGGSKLARVIALLERDHGATIEELIAATGWLADTTRAALTGLRKRGYAVAIDRSDDKRGSFYRNPRR